MKSFVIAAVAALALSGCGAMGGGQKAAMVKACTESGESDANCTCIADSLEEAGERLFTFTRLPPPTRSNC